MITRGFRRAVEQALGYSGWVDWTPTVTQGVGVAVTVTEAKYCVVGKVCHLYAKLVLASAGTGGQRVVIGGVPVAAQTAYTNSIVGQAHVRDAGTTRYAGQLYALTASTFCIFVDGNADQLGATPAYTIANTDELWITATYRVA